MKKTLVEASRTTPFDIYKFIGDGWILLFDEDTISGEDLINVLYYISQAYQQSYHNGICAVLGHDNNSIGLTYDIDHGTLIKVVMNTKAEYIGRALNVASRLQGAVKDVDAKPLDKVLISKNSYELLQLDKNNRTKGKLIACNLRNVAGGEKYQVRIINLRLGAS